MIETTLGRDPTYVNMMSYLLSNAVAGELTAVQHYTALIGLTETESERRELMAQAREEGRHIRMLRTIGRERGFTVLDNCIEPEWVAIRDSFSEAVYRRDRFACLLIQEVMVETVAITLYELLSSATQVDSTTREVMAEILAEENEHLDGGVEKLRALRLADPAAAERALVWAHDQIMPELYGIASTDCEKLCDDLNVCCDALNLDAVGAELIDLRADASAKYLDTLYRVGFDYSEVQPIADSMSGVELLAEDGRISCC